MEKRMLSGLLSVLLLIACVYATAPAPSLAAGGAQIRLNFYEATYFLGETPYTPLTATLENAPGGSLVIWNWYINGSTEPIHTDESVGTSASILPDTSKLGTFSYVLKATIPAESPDDREQIITSDPAVINVVDPKTVELFRVLKHDEAGRPLSGAVFQILNTETGDTYEATSGEDGFVVFRNPIDDGHYILSEKTAPSGYKKSDQTQELWVDGTSAGFMTNDRRGDFIIFVNEKLAPVIQEFEVLKEDDQGNPLAGATLRLEGLTDDGIPRVVDVTSNAYGSAWFTIETGSYELSEYAAPEGYNRSDETYSIVVTPNGVFINHATHLDAYEPVTFINKPIPTLNKDDHIAYVQGYPNGTFGPALNMNRAEAVVMFSRLLLGGMDTTTDYRNNYYPDVKPDDWFANAVGYMQGLGVLVDYSRDINFRPLDPVTRAEFATLAAHFDSLTLTATNIFSDVPNDHWAVKYINSAAAKGWILGYVDGTFKPEAKITRAEVVTLVNRILVRTADQGFVNTNTSAMPRNYTDLTDTTYWAYWAIIEASTGHDFIRDGEKENWTEVYK